MFIDMHIHERSYSPDSHISLEEIVTRAKMLGLDAVCITDHDSMGLKQAAEAYAREINFPIFVGIEYFSLQGDITAWGLKDYPRERIPAQDFINEVRRQDGFCVACHPYRTNNRGLGDLLYSIEGLDGVEVLNGSTKLEHNQLALKASRDLQLKPIGVSDAHVLKQVGVYASWIDADVCTLEGFVRALREGRTEAAILRDTGYERVLTF